MLDLLCTKATPPIRRFNSLHEGLNIIISCQEDRDEEYGTFSQNSPRTYRMTTYRAGN